MKKVLLIIFISLLIIVAAVLVLFVLNLDKALKKQNHQKPSSTPSSTQPSSSVKKPALIEPISNAKSRITKKPFGIYITPQTSPVQPEKFTGYHTGTDFETTPAEANADVPVSAVCTGKIRVQGIVQGYGGVIVQNCALDNQPVTVLYGHLNIRQAHVLSIGQEIKAGEKIAVLAPANSELSGGERKHLHLGIHKGSSIDYRGYVQDQPELSDWLDIHKYL